MMQQLTDQNLELEMTGLEAIPEDKAKEIYIEKAQKDFEAEKSLANLPSKAKDPRMIQGLIMMKRAQVVDQITIDHGFTSAQITQAAKTYNLNEDEEVKAALAAIDEEKNKVIEEKKEQMKQAMKLDEEEQKEVDALCGAETIDATPDEAGHITADEWLKIYRIVVTLGMRFTFRREEQMRGPRRASYHNKDYREFDLAVFHMLQLQDKVRQQVNLAVLEALSIDPVLYNKSSMFLKDSKNTSLDE